MQRVLVLNASWEPLTTVSWQRAVGLLLDGDVEVMEVSDRLARSEHLTVMVPMVVRLLEFREVPFKARSPLTRRGVLARDNHVCCYCTRRKATTVDHIQPRSRKGQHSWENVVAACSPCNAFKDNRTPDEALLDTKGAARIGFGPMRFQPRLPAGNVALVVAVGYMDPSWEPYLNLSAVA